jgi:hypothetical protein
VTRKSEITTLCILVLALLSACGITGNPSKNITHDVTPLPHSMKGYELYSWVEEGDWHFTLLMGTNRMKTEEEITSGDSQGDVVAEHGLVRVSVVEVEKVKVLLSGLPPGEEMIWRGSRWFEEVGIQTTGLALPPMELVEDLKAYCQELEIILQLAE